MIRFCSLCTCLGELYVQRHLEQTEFLAFPASSVSDETIHSDLIARHRIWHVFLKRSFNAFGAKKYHGSNSRKTLTNHSINRLRYERF